MDGKRFSLPLIRRNHTDVTEIEDQAFRRRPPDRGAEEEGAMRSRSRLNPKCLLQAASTPGPHQVAGSQDCRDAGALGGSGGILLGSRVLLL